MGGAPRRAGGRDDRGAAHRTLTVWDQELNAWVRAHLDKDFFEATGRRPYGLGCPDCNEFTQLLIEAFKASSGSVKGGA